MACKIVWATLNAAHGCIENVNSLINSKTLCSFRFQTALVGFTGSFVGELRRSHS